MEPPVLPAHISRPAPGHYEALLPGGTLRMTMRHEEMPLPEICDFALRHNARRRFLFVSKVLGRHMPTRPAALHEVAARLAVKISISESEGPVLFFGMAETATTLAQAVFAAWCRLGGKGLYIESTRRRSGGPVAFEFVESHSHAMAHLVHLPLAEDDPLGCFQTAGRVVVVDDEATTGRTALGLVASYAQWRGIQPSSLHRELAVLARWMSATDLIESEFADFHALVEGTFEFVETGLFAEAPPQVTHADRTGLARRGARHGLAHPQPLPWQVTAAPGERILVVGTGEFGYQPLLLAAALEAQGATAWVQATTRSPVLPGGAIGHARSFPALSGERHTEFLYNVPDDHSYDRVLLCCEDTLLPPDHPIHHISRLEVLPLPGTLRP